MDGDDRRDFEDYSYQPQLEDEDSDDFGHNVKSLVKVLVDSMEFSADELESAVYSLATPSDSVPDSGTSLREAIEVRLCQYLKGGRHSVISYAISHTTSHVISYAIFPGRHDSQPG